MMTSDVLLHAISSTPGLSYVLALLIQSVVVLSVFYLVDLAVRHYRRTCQPLMSQALWKSAFYLLLTLPFLPLLSSSLKATAPLTGIVSPIFELSVTVGQASEQQGFNLAPILLILYLAVALILLLRLGRSYYRLKALASRARMVGEDAVEESQLNHKLQRCAARLALTHPVNLMTSQEIDSPVSFGFRQRTIVLPANYQLWSESAMTDVLLHELCHLRRNDWLNLMLSHVLCAIYWVNPGVWFAQRRLLDVTENRCDQEVVSLGRDQVTYAESLLGVAHSCQQYPQQPSVDWLPAQSMFDQNTLKTRLNQVLKETTMQNNQIARSLKQSVWGSSALSLLVLSTLAFNPILSAQERQPEQPSLQSQAEQPAQAAKPSRMERPTQRQQVAQAPSAAREPAPRQVDQELRPLHQVEAAYPAAASDDGIEGWAQVKFTVSEEGTVPVDSISLVDAEPSRIFDDSAKAAIAQFRFQPRVVNGQAVAVPNVQYVFRFTMDDE